MRRTLAVLVCVLVPGLVQAQEAARLPRNDMTFSTGWIGANYRGVRSYDSWHGSVFGGVGIGHYWTDNLKTEVEAGWLSTAKMESYDTINIGPDRAYVESDYILKDLRLSFSQCVQFGRNEWTHPFLGVGVDVDYLRTTEDRPPQQAYAYTGSQSRSVFVPGAREREARFRAVPFVKGGVKMYFSDRAFVVQEFKFGVSSRLDHVLWKTGVGIDF